MWKYIILLTYIGLAGYSCQNENHMNRRFAQGISAETKQIKPSQVIYFSNMKSKLTKKQLSKLSQYINTLDQIKSEVWFVRVISHKDDFVNADIYFLPYIQHERIWKGNWISYISMHGKEHLLDNLIEPENEKYLLEYCYVLLPCKKYLLEYCQLLLPYKLFLSSTVPTQDIRMPFRAPEGFSDKEIIEIIDFIHSKPEIVSVSKANNSNQDSTETDFFLYEIDLDLPIRSISRKGNIIEVETGTMYGVLAGSGEILTIRKTEDGYELLSVGMWLS